MHPMIEAVKDRLVIVAPAKADVLMTAAALFRKVRSAGLACVLENWLELDPSTWPPGREVIVLAPTAVEATPDGALSWEDLVESSELPAFLKALKEHGHDLLAAFDDWAALNALRAHGELAEVDFFKLVAPLDADREQGSAVADSRMDYVTAAFGEPKAGEYADYLHQAALYRGGFGTWRANELQKLIDDRTIDAVLLEQAVLRLATGKPPIDDATAELLKSRNSELDAAIAESVFSATELEPSIWLVESESGLLFPHGVRLFAYEFRHRMIAQRSVAVEALISQRDQGWVVNLFGTLLQLATEAPRTLFADLSAVAQTELAPRYGIVMVPDVDTARLVLTALKQRK